MTSSPVTRLIKIGLILFVAVSSGCSVAETKAKADPASDPKLSDQANAAKNETGGSTISIDPNGPADTVRVFYEDIKEGKFRDAIFLTNLRPAIEGLTDTELKEFALDFQALAGQVPADLKINGEIITGDVATVTANLPNEDGDKTELQAIKLRRENGVWIILSVDEEAEKQIKKEGKNYFYVLKIQTHEEEARKMLDRVSNAELAYSLQNGGVYADEATLISAGLLPDDIKTSASTGYNYSLTLASDKKHFSVAAVPATYGKSGKLSFKLGQDDKNLSHLTSKDNGGNPLK